MISSVRSDIVLYLEKNISSERLKHSVSTAETAVELSKPFFLSETGVYFAGFVHDIARELSISTIISFAEKDGSLIDDFERLNPLLLHGKAGAHILKSNFRIENKSLLDAVRFHTLGNVDMDDLAKIIFIADYAEPRREYYDPIFFRKLKNVSIDEMMIMVLSESFKYYKDSLYSKKLLAYLKGGCFEKNK